MLNAGAHYFKQRQQNDLCPFEVSPRDASLNAAGRWWAARSPTGHSSPAIPVLPLTHTPWWSLLIWGFWWCLHLEKSPKTSPHNSNEGRRKTGHRKSVWLRCCCEHKSHLIRVQSWTELTGEQGQPPPTHPPGGPLHCTTRLPRNWLPVDRIHQVTSGSYHPSFSTSSLPASLTSHPSEQAARDHTIPAMGIRIAGKSQAQTRNQTARLRS